ncbi:hypothetical protein GCM10010358_68110 [Streptomyces minutiscleroticus]|uniref:Uncharacterized protein n=1 Tax=Streptomyces minutiscleroticus TaxID=68238 RepID=A0A918NYU4_9ACTN|nr:hypothetical protein [Streptomyces minutiscleroticus]GGY05103.1 hypothetical protein GCM10010358_68110 [Streptomyces minutiscleroticus]
MSAKRPFFVVGRSNGSQFDVWHTEEAPADPMERNELHEEYRIDALEESASVTLVYAHSEEEARRTVRAEVREAAIRGHIDIAAGRAGRAARRRIQSRRTVQHYRR